MAYTLSDWLRDNAQVRVRLPAPNTMDGWTEEWVPLSALLGEGGPEWTQQRTTSGREARDFRAALWGKADEKVSASDGE